MKFWCTLFCTGDNTCNLSCDRNVRENFSRNILQTKKLTYRSHFYLLCFVIFHKRKDFIKKFHKISIFKTKKQTAKLRLKKEV